MAGDGKLDGGVGPPAAIFAGNLDPRTEILGEVLDADCHDPIEALTVLATSVCLDARGCLQGVAAVLRRLRVRDCV
ncbi:hypothetical protein, partial [Corynebacterium sanguinis]|uniref:hypothetical protein n=1 Tax=Corynebacterium sanguinis TaxID=2594913 RepID=UPI0035CCE75F